MADILTDLKKEAQKAMITVYGVNTVVSSKAKKVVNSTAIELKNTSAHVFAASIVVEIDKVLQGKGGKAAEKNIQKAADKIDKN